MTTAAERKRILAEGARAAGDHGLADDWDREADELESPIEITTPSGSNVISVIRIATDRAEKALERGDWRAAQKAFESIRNYAMKAQRARSPR
jgi:hypothetical protein